MTMCIGVSNKARTIKEAYIGVSNRSRKIVKGWIGVGNKARLFYTAGPTRLIGYRMTDTNATRVCKVYYSPKWSPSPPEGGYWYKNRFTYYESSGVISWYMYPSVYPNCIMSFPDKYSLEVSGIPPITSACTSYTIVAYDELNGDSAQVPMELYSSNNLSYPIAGELLNPSRVYS